MSTTPEIPLDAYGRVAFKTSEPQAIGDIVVVGGVAYEVTAIDELGNLSLKKVS